MNTSFATALALTFILSNSAGLLSAQSSHATTAISATFQSQDDRPAVLMTIPALPSAGESPFLLKVILDAGANIRDRLQAVRFLGDDLSRSEIDACCCFLQSHPDAQEKNLAGLRALKNDLINALKDQSIPPAGLTATLIGMFGDRAQDFVTRDYAIQHLTSWYGRGAGDAPDAKERIRATLTEAAQENTSIAGTALLGLHRLSLTDKSFDGAAINRTALAIATSPETLEAARITAIQICAERGIVQALPEIERFAEAHGQTALQLSAIAALGKLGKAQDTAVLQRLESGGDVALRPALVVALKRLTPRLASRGPF